jgi:hypothetical protein
MWSQVLLGPGDCELGADALIQSVIAHEECRWNAAQGRFWCLRLQPVLF